MLRYMSFLWDEQDEQAGLVARRLLRKFRAQNATWETSLDECGFVVLSLNAPVFRAARGNRSIVVLGHLFDRVMRVPHPLDPAIAGPLESAGRDLVRNYWGNYVAFLREPGTETRWVLRSPAGTLPCLHATYGGVDLYFSWTEACARLGVMPFSINWRYVGRSLVGPLASAETGINEITEIMPGFCEETRGDEVTLHCYWNPVSIAKEDPISDFRAAARALHDVTKSCVHAWARRTPKLLHALSGGLDSSIVLGCLQDAPAQPEITALTYFADGPDSDERTFARCAVQWAHCQHIEQRRDDSDVDLRHALCGARLERSTGLRIPAVDRIEPECAASVGAQAIYKGHGGDELFCRHHTQYYVADALRGAGLSAGTLGLLLHSAVTEGESIWTILAGAIRNAFVPRRWDLASIFEHDQEGQSLLQPEVWREARADGAWELPFARSTRECPPGKLWQISLATGWRPYYLPFTEERDPPVIAPLLSQPVIETCLRIPTYLQMAHRMERAVARAAFTAEVPRAILERRWKGGAEPLAWRLFRRNLAFIRELLLDGRLVRERIVDRRRLEAALSLSPDSPLSATVPVFELVGMEAWLNAWSPAAGGG